MIGRRWRGTAVAFVVAIVGFNALTYRHARAMTRFVPNGKRTARPETMTFAQKLSVLASGATLPRRVNERTPEDVGLAFERRRFATSDGETLEAWFVPHRNARGTVLMFHGYADRKASLLDATAAFHELGYACLLVDFRGSGGSSGETTSIGYHEALDVFAALVHATSAALPQPLVVFGASMGAAAALRAVGELGAAPAALLLQYPFSRMSTTVSRRFEAMGVPAFPSAPLLVFWGGVQLGFNGFRHNPVEYAKNVRVATLLMQGDRDDRVSMEEAREIFGALAGTKRLRIFHGAGHVSLVKADPSLWKASVREVLEPLTERPAP